jgi:uncharacterized protein
MVQPIVATSNAETRFKAIGKTAQGRSLFVVFTSRDRAGQRLIRPISACYMHNKEIAAHENETP